MFAFQISIYCLSALQSRVYLQANVMILYCHQFDVLSGLGLYYNGGTTSTSEAINVLSEEMFTRENGAREDVTGIGVIITDGRSDDPQLTWQNAMEAREGGIHLITLGIGKIICIISRPIESDLLWMHD